MKKTLTLILASIILVGCASVKQSCERENAALNAENLRLVKYKTTTLDSYIKDFKKIPGWEYSFLSPEDLQKAYIIGYNNSVDDLVARAKDHNERCFKGEK